MQEQTDLFEAWTEELERRDESEREGEGSSCTRVDVRDFVCIPSRQTNG